MSAVAVIFLAVAAITFVGFGAGRFFLRTRFPDAPLLLAVGLLLGPVNRLFALHGWGSKELAAALSPDALEPAAPLIAGIALVVILFDSGLELRLKAVRASLGAAVLHTGAIFVLTVGLVATLLHILFGLPWIVALCLAIALANVDQSVSSGLVNQLKLTAPARAVATLEMAIYDLVSVPLLVSLFTFAQSSGGPAERVVGFARSFTSLFSVSVAIGGAAGLLWAYALRGLKGHPHSYMLTFAAVLATFGLAEAAGGSGGIAVLLFGLIVGNRRAVMRGLSGIRETDSEGAKVQAFHDEITFLVRTVFFLYLGVSFAPDLGSGGGLVIAAAILLTAAMVVARWAGIRATAWGASASQRDLVPILGRGLDTAVLAALPFVAAPYVAGTAYFALFSPWRRLFLDVALLIVLTTVVVASLLAFLQERFPRRRPRSAAKE
ncbi:MAG: cation:proton antiporter domain-containing protein [Thermoplasmatota archaeon]